MRQTLIEVLGEEKGTALYTMDWLIAIHCHSREGGNDEVFKDGLRIIL